MNKLLKTSSGQVVVEYTILITALLAIIISAMNIIKTKLLADGTNCQAQTISAVCIIKNNLAFGEGAGSNKFKRFRLMRNN